MSSLGTNSTETWRVLIVTRDGQEILVHPDGVNLSLPQVAIPVRERTAANINRAVKENLGVRVACLYEVAPRDSSAPAGVPCHAAVAIEDGQSLPEGTEWRKRPSLTANSFATRADFQAFDDFWWKLEAGKANCPSEPFLEPDSFAEVKSWVQDSLRSHMLQLTGAFRQLNASATFSLIRFATNEAPAWFKAVGEPNLREYSVTLALAQLCPAYVPRIFASRPTWHAWLAAQAPGHSLMSDGAMQSWELAASSLANLQIATIGETRKLLQAGARDLRVRSLLSHVEPFFRSIADCSGSIPPGSSGTLTPSEIPLLEAGVRLAITELDHLGMIETVGHMDLNPANIFCGAARSVFLDWAESFLGCPVLSYEYLLQHFRGRALAEPISEERLRSAYLRPWQRILSPEDLDRALVLSPLVALFGYAVTVWTSSLRATPPCLARQNYLIRLVCRMKREAARREPEKAPL